MLEELSLWHEEVFEVLATTALQAALSSVLALFVGVIGGLGLIWAGGQMKLSRSKWLESLVLLPNTAPVLILLLSVAKLFPWARGLLGIVFVHALLNSGLVAVAFVHLVRAKMAGLIELAFIEGATGPHFFRRGVWPLLSPDFRLLSFFIFALCFSSFAIPLAIGGSRSTTIEVLIYQRLRIDGDWLQASVLSLVQIALILMFAFWLRGSWAASQAMLRAQTNAQSTAWRLLRWWPGLICALAPTAIVMFGLIDGLGRGLHQLLRSPQIGSELPGLILGSAVIGFSVGLLVLSALLWLAYLQPRGLLRTWLIGASTPSAVLTGFAILLIWRTLGWASYLKIAFALALVTLPALYRFYWDSVLSSLGGQIGVARTLGASRWLTFCRIIFPQTIGPAGFLAGLAALWAWGDFALSTVIAERVITVAQLAQSMMNSYRMEAATGVVWLSIFGGLLTFVIFAGAGHVLGSKSQA